MSTTNEDPRSELAAIAVEIARHLHWAQSKGERELPIAAAEAARPAPRLQAPGRGLQPPSAQVPGRGLQPPSAQVPDAPPAPQADARARRAEVLQPDRAGSREAHPSAPPAPWADVPAPRTEALQADRPDSSPPPASGQRLASIRADLGDCRRCKLCEGRKQIVFGDGSPTAELVFVGEGPGFEEDQRGLPFVGPAGQLLDKMIEAMGYRRDQVYIANVVKCRPPRNRAPEPDEVAACEPFLQAQLASIRPKAIVALGKSAAQTLLRDQTPITRLRGQWREYQGIPLMPTFHPAYLLRSPQEKGKAWADLQQVMALLGRHRPGR